MDMPSAVGSGVQDPDFLARLGWFGQQFGESCLHLNDLCVNFYNHIQRHIFLHERDYTEALDVFRSSVLNSSGGTRNQKQELFLQIKAILLNPAADVQDRCARLGHISQSISQIRCLLQGGNSVQSSLQVCSKCGTSGGFMAKCSGRRCKQVFHIKCAESTLANKKYFTKFYRCKQCSASEIQATKARGKSKRKRGDPDSERATEEADGSAISSNESAEDGAASTVEAAREASDIGESAADAASKSVDLSATASPEHLTSASAFNRDVSPLYNGCTFAFEDSSAREVVPSYNDFDLKEMEKVSDEIKAVFSALQSAQSQLKLIGQAKVSEQNVDLFKSILSAIRALTSSLNSLTANDEPLSSLNVHEVENKTFSSDSHTTPTPLSEFADFASFYDSSSEVVAEAIATATPAKAVASPAKRYEIAEMNADRVKSPPSHLPFVCLPNVQQSCWLNSSLQCLLHTTELALLFLDTQFDASSLQDADVPLSLRFKNGPNIAALFQTIVISSTPGGTICRSVLQQLKREVDTILDGRDREKIRNSGWYKDSSEGLIVLIEAICPSMFRLPFQSQIVCQNCSKESNTCNTDFLTLQFIASATPSLGECLTAFFAPEILGHSDQYTCSRCQGGQNHSKQLFLDNTQNPNVAFPDFFFVYLKRFETGPKGSKRIDTRIDVPLEYDFGQHCVVPVSQTFRLYAVVCHRPGHYYAYCQPNPDVQWTKLDDEKKIISSSDYSHVCDDIRSNGYIFFFRHTSPALNERPNSAEPFTQRPAIEELQSIGISQSIAASVLASAAGNQQHAINSINGLVVQQTEIVSLPRHFLFSYSHSIFADFQNRARLSVQNQNEEVLRAVINCTKLFEELKIHLTRGYDTSIKNIYSAYPGCYPEAYFDHRDDKGNLPSEFYRYPTAPCIGDHFIADRTVNWFFKALTAFFPGAMYLPSGLFRYLAAQSAVQALHFGIWKENFYSRCPYAVLFSLNLPQDYSCPASEKNPDYHWVFIGIDLTWAQRAVSQASLRILDPFNNIKCHQAVSLWFQNNVAKALGFTDVNIKPHNENFVKLQCGRGNAHCGVFTMALGLNFLTRTLDEMGQHLIKDLSDTNATGLELRKLVAWDCICQPPLLNACLAMSPILASLPDLPEHDAWWRVTHCHDIATALTLQPELADGGLFHVMSTNPRGNKMVRHAENDACMPGKGKVPTDGPFFFQNEKFFVKVVCMGLLSDKIPHSMRCKRSIQRAGLGLLESSATDFVCKKHKIWVATFGLICIGMTTPCAFVCVGREILSPIAEEISDEQLGCLFNSMASEPLCVFHHDPYRRNVMVDVNGVLRAVDFERASRCEGRAPIALFFQYYASSVASNNQASIQIMMVQIRWSGLDRANDHFSGFVRDRTFLQNAFNSSAFERIPPTSFRYAGFWHLMDLLCKAAGVPELAKIGSNTCISCIIGRERALCNIFFEYSSTGAICITSAVLPNAGQKFLWRGAISDPTEDQALELLTQLLNDVDQQQQELVG